MVRSKICASPGAEAKATQLSELPGPDRRHIIYADMMPAADPAAPLAMRARASHPAIRQEHPAMHDLRILTSFAQAVRSGSFTIAARVLQCSPGAVSKNVARLEQDLGIRLFHRTTRQLRLTDEGARFYDAIDAGLCSFEYARNVIAAAREEVSGRISMLVGTSVGKCHVLPVIGQFLETYPNVRLELAFSDEVPDLVANGFDLALRYGEPDDSRYIGRRLCALPLILVASADYIARRGKPRSPADLADHDCITARLAGVEYGWRLAPRAGGLTGAATVVRPKARLVITDHVEAMMPAVLEGLGISVVPVHAASRYLADGTLVRLLPDHHVESDVDGSSDIHLVYPYRHHLPVRVRALKDFLIAKLATNAPPEMVAVTAEAA
jgi:DNA-binding transcriptional LysR family regulator